MMRYTETICRSYFIHNKESEKKWSTFLG
uniref:Uncharacterized protein n=1 Tax=Anguilla anguilla TaxID=7936 RepID=A0A0E9TGX7_ANGAN